jgi:hypothetical protein
MSYVRLIMKGKRKPVMSFSCPPELRAKIKEFAEANGLNESAAIRLMILSCLRGDVILSNDSNDKSKSSGDVKNS